MEIKVIKKQAINTIEANKKEDENEKRRTPNRAFDPDLAPYENAAYVLWSGFSFLESIPPKEHFESVCRVLRNAELGALRTVTFQKGVNGDGVTFENEIIESKLNDEILRTLCHMSIIDRAYFLFDISGRSLMIIAEKSRCDVCVFYDVRLFSKNSVLNLKSTIEEEYHSQERKKFGIVRF